MVINDEFKGCSTQMRAERERLGYSREQIAERAHISPRYLAAIELGEKIPKADVMVRIIRAMGASADAIFYGPQQEVENESKHLAQIILQCTPKERMLIAAIVDTILDVRQRECLSYAQAHHQYFLISGSFYLARDSSLLFYACDFISASYKSTTA